MADNRADFDKAVAAMPLIAIFRGIKPEEAMAVSEAVVAAGVTVLEVPLNSPEPYRSVRMLADAFAGRAIIGVGTALNVEHVERSAEAGATLVLSPNFNEAVVKRTTALGMVSIPGVFTPTEAFAALDAGADALKFFPAELLGPSVVRGLKAVLPKTARMMLTGGVTVDNIAAFRAAGAEGFGIGSALYKPGISAAEAGTRARAFVAAAQDAATKAA